MAGRGRGGVSLMPKFELSASLERALLSLHWIDHQTGRHDDNEPLDAKGQFFEIFDWLRANNHYTNKGVCKFPSNFAVIGCFYDGNPEISPVTATKPGLFHTLTCVDCALPQSSTWRSDIGYRPVCEPHCLFLHELYASDPLLSLGSLTWTSIWVGGRYAAAILDFNTFFAGDKSFTAKAKYVSWMHSEPANLEQERIRAAMPSLAPELAVLMSQRPKDSLASLMLSLVRTTRLPTT